MTDIRLRPTFRKEVGCTPNDLMDALSGALSTSSGIRGAVYEASCMLRVPLDEVHFWSPQLQVSIDTVEDGHTIVHGIFGPRPAVWSMFIALYVAIVFAGSMGVIYGFSQLTLGDNPFALWAGPAAIVLYAAVYFVGRVGRRLGHDQMIQLKEFLDHVISNTDSTSGDD